MENDEIWTDVMIWFFELFGSKGTVYTGTVSTGMATFPFTILNSNTSLTFLLLSAELVQPGAFTIWWHY